MLNKIGSCLPLTNDLITILDMIVAEAINMTGADGGTLYLLDREKEELDFYVLINHSLNIHLLDMKDDKRWVSIPLYLFDGTPNDTMVVAVCAREDKLINIRRCL